MKTITEFPHEVRVIENTFIPMRDGAQLAARIWLPVDAEELPVPAVLEYLPYRKRDSTRGMVNTTKRESSVSRNDRHLM